MEQVYSNVTGCSNKAYYIHMYCCISRWMSYVCHLYVSENISSSVSAQFSSAASESLASRARATVQDPVFQMMKVQFTTDFDFAVPGSMKLQNLIVKLRKWIQILETKVKTLPKWVTSALRVAYDIKNCSSMKHILALTQGSQSFWYCRPLPKSTYSCTPKAQLMVTLKDWIITKKIHT